MKIVVCDIDDTITYETDFMLEKAPKFLEKYKLGTDIVNLQGNNLGEVFGLKEKFINNGMEVEKAEQEAKRVTDAFWNKYFVVYNARKFRPSVKNTIDTLRGYGYEIHFLSLRGKQTKEANKKNEFVREKIVPLITKIALWKNRIRYDNLTLVSSEQEKLDYIKYYNPQIIFDDYLTFLNGASKDAIKICMDTLHNSFGGGGEEDNIYRIKDFKDSISIIEKYLDGTDKSIDKSCGYSFCITRVFQRLAKIIAGWYFIQKYKPIVLGKELIPYKGGVAFIGNHRNKLDPVFITLTSGKTIQWAALLRMFQGKEDLFSLRKSKPICTLSAKFITLMGALPIARPGDENFEIVNMNTINKLTEMLAKKHSIGFFPEGTINRTPETVNVLPLKSNRIFRMATETDSYIQPVSIVWLPEKCRVKNKLVIIYSYPINTYHRNKKEVRDIWLETVNTNIEYAKEIIEQYYENGGVG